MIRLDKLISNMNIATRSEAKKLIKTGKIKADGVVITSPEEKVSENAVIEYNNQIYSYEKFEYYMLNKPKGVISATVDRDCKTVVDLISCRHSSDIFPVGRLDKDTEGLLLITNDGELAHELLSPVKHVDKTYYVETEEMLSNELIKIFNDGMTLKDGTVFKSAKLEILDDKKAYVTITEGKYHQVKRMFEYCDNKVLYLKRLSMGHLTLDEKLKPGEYRKLTKEEVDLLR